MEIIGRKSLAKNEKLLGLMIRRTVIFSAIELTVCLFTVAIRKLIT